MEAKESENLRSEIEERRKEFEKLSMDREKALRRLATRRIHTAQVEQRIRLLERALREAPPVDFEVVESLLAAEEFARQEKRDTQRRKVAHIAQRLQEE